MDDNEKTASLNTELTELRQRVAELEQTAEAYRYAAASLRQVETYWRDLVANAPVTIGVFDTAGTIRYVNRAAGDQRPEQLVGRLVYDYLEPDVQAELRQVLAGVFASGTGASYEARTVRQDGTTAWFATYLSPLQSGGDIDAVVFVATDITARKEAEQILHEHEAFYQALFATNPAVKLLIDPTDGQVIDANPAASAFYGYSADELRRMRITEINIHDEAQVRQAMLRALRREQTYFQFQHRLASGAIRDVEVFSGPIEFRGRRLLLSIIHDISERRRAEADAIKAARLEVATTLAGGVAHQVNNLMAIILGYAELLREDPAQAEAPAMIDAICRSAQRAGDLAQRMLDFARGGVYQPQPGNLNTMIADVAWPWLEQRSAARGVILEPHLAPDLWPVAVDQAQMSQVLVNLLTNALEALSDQGGRIIVTTENIVVDGRTQPDPGFWRLQWLAPGRYVRLAVADDGCGMDAAVLQRVCEPFFSTKFQGRGLGLAAVYGIIENHGGGIGLQSKVDDGTTVAIYLPALAAELTPARVREPAPALETQTVLLVDDDTVLRTVVRRLLEWSGYTVLDAASGDAALALAGSDARIDVTLLDLDMPGLSGAQAFPLLRTLRPELPILLFSGYGPDATVEALLDAGAAGFLQKPLRHDDLSAAIARVVGGR